MSYCEQDELLKLYNETISEPQAGSQLRTNKYSANNMRAVQSRISTNSHIYKKQYDGRPPKYKLPKAPDRMQKTLELPPITYKGKQNKSGIIHGSRSTSHLHTLTSGDKLKGSGRLDVHQTNNLRAKRIKIPSQSTNHNNSYTSASYLNNHQKWGIDSSEMDEEYLKKNPQGGSNKAAIMNRSAIDYNALIEMQEPLRYPLGKELSIGHSESIRKRKLSGGGRPKGSPKIVNSPMIPLKNFGQIGGNPNQLFQTSGIFGNSLIRKDSGSDRIGTSRSNYSSDENIDELPKSRRNAFSIEGNKQNEKLVKKRTLKSSSVNTNKKSQFLELPVSGQLSNKGKEDDTNSNYTQIKKNSSLSSISSQNSIERPAIVINKINSPPKAEKQRQSMGINAGRRQSLGKASDLGFNKPQTRHMTTMSPQNINNRNIKSLIREKSLKRSESILSEKISEESDDEEDEDEFQKRKANTRARQHRKAKLVTLDFQSEATNKKEDSPPVESTSPEFVDPRKKKKTTKFCVPKLGVYHSPQADTDRDQSYISPIHISSKYNEKQGKKKCKKYKTDPIIGEMLNKQQFREYIPDKKREADMGEDAKCKRKKDYWENRILINFWPKIDEKKRLDVEIRKHQLLNPQQGNPKNHYDRVTFDDILNQKRKPKQI